MFQVRPETPADHEAIRQVHLAAFPTDEETRLVDALREGGEFLESLVCESDGIVGHILFSRLEVDGLRGAALGPVAVLPEHQRQGAGAALIREGIERCRNLGIDVIILVGHTEYYPRFGFSSEAGRNYSSPYSGYGDVWMALELRPLPAEPRKVVYPSQWPT